VVRCTRGVQNVSDRPIQVSITAALNIQAQQQHAGIACASQDSVPHAAAAITQTCGPGVRSEVRGPGHPSSRQRAAGASEYPGSRQLSLHRGQLQCLLYLLFAIQAVLSVVRRISSFVPVCVSCPVFALCCLLSIICLECCCR
jgi:hypothetical protein